WYRLHDHQIIRKVRSPREATGLDEDIIPGPGLVEEAGSQHLEIVGPIAPRKLTPPHELVAGLLDLDAEVSLVALGVRSTADVFALHPDRTFPDHDVEVGTPVGVVPDHILDDAAALQFLELLVQEPFRELALDVDLGTEPLLDRTEDVPARSVELELERVLDGLSVVRECRWHPCLLREKVASSRLPRERGKWNPGARNGTRGDPCCKPVQQTARLQQKSRDFPGNSRLRSIQCIVRTFNQALCFEPPSTRVQPSWIRHALTPRTTTTVRPTSSRGRPAPTCFSTRTTRLTGIPGGPGRSIELAARTSRSFCRSVTRPATGAM